MAINGAARYNTGYQSILPFAGLASPTALGLYGSQSRDSISQKRCIKCGKNFPATSEFFSAYKKVYRPSQKTITGLIGTCRECDRTRLRESARRYADDRRASSNEYYKTHKEEFALAKRAWLNNNPEKAKEHNRRSSENYRKNHPEAIAARSKRTKEANSDISITSSSWQYALDYFGGCCAVCGRPAGLWHTIAKDHWIPLSDPSCPGTIPTNIVPLCHGVDGCNNSKSYKNAEQWLTEKYGKRKANQIVKRISKYFDAIKNRAVDE